MQVLLTDAIQQIRDDLREAVRQGKGMDIVFTPTSIEVELAITFTAELKAEGGFKLLAFLDLSSEATASRESQHKIKLSLSVADKDGQSLEISDDEHREDF